VAQEKLEVKEILSWIDNNCKEIWDELEDEHKKQISFWLLNRYVSSVSGNRDKQELAVFKTNEYYNKNWAVLGTKHSKLQWQLLCISGNTGKNEFHPWIGLNQKKDSNSKIIKFLKDIYPNKKLEEVELLARILTKKEVTELAQEYGIDKIDI
jgi:hypothetical protein